MPLHVDALRLPPSKPSAELSRRVEKVVGYPPLCDLGTERRREFQEALLEADTFEDRPGKWHRARPPASQSKM